MRVFLFGLSSRRTNLMDPGIEFIQLVLSTSVSHLVDDSLHAWMNMLIILIFIHYNLLLSLVLILFIFIIHCLPA